MVQFQQLDVKEVIIQHHSLSKIVLELQEMLHRENVLVKDFKMIAHEYPQDKVETVEFILKKDGKPQQSYVNQGTLPSGQVPNEVFIRKKSCF